MVPLVQLLGGLSVFFMVLMAQQPVDELPASPPPTVRELAGHSAPPLRAHDAVLVIIGAQREHVDGALPLAGVDAALEQIREVRRWARARELPILHVVHHGPPGAPLFDPRGPFAEIVAQLTPYPDEPVLSTSQPNAFTRGEFEETLSRLGRKQVILVGFSTHLGLSATAHGAHDHGYQTFVVAAATASRRLPGAPGQTLSAEAVKAATLAGLGERVATVVPDARTLAAQAAE